MRFSKWHALGNTYLLVERAELAEPLAPDERAAPMRCTARGGRRRRSRGSGRPRGRGGRRRLEPGRLASGAQRQRSTDRRALACPAERRRLSADQVRRALDSRPGRGRRRRGRSRGGAGRVGPSRWTWAASGSSSRPPRSGTRTLFSAESPPARTAPSSRSARRAARPVSRPNQRPARTPRRPERPDGARLGTRGGGDRGVRVECRRGSGRRDHPRLV